MTWLWIYLSIHCENNVLYYRQIYHWQQTERILSPEHHQLCLTSPWHPIFLIKVLQTKILRIEDIIQCCFISAISEWNALEHQEKCKMLESNKYLLKKAFPSLFWRQGLKHFFGITFSCITSSKILRTSLLHVMLFLINTVICASAFTTFKFPWQTFSLADFEYATICNGTAVIRSFQKNFFYHPPQFHIFEGK